MSLLGSPDIYPAAGAAGAAAVSGSNHGSAAVALATAALPQSAEGAMMTVPPAGMVGAATATEQARARGVQHLGDPASAGFRHGSPAALGAELSDDSLTMSPTEKLPHKRGAAKRDARANLPSGKRLALSLAASPDAARVALRT